MPLVACEDVPLKINNFNEAFFSYTNPYINFRYTQLSRHKCEMWDVIHGVKLSNLPSLTEQKV